MRGRRQRQGGPTAWVGRRSWPALWAVCVVLIAAWSLAAPLYSGPDEPAHVLRAVSLDHGQLLGRPSGAAGSPDTTVVVPGWLSGARNAPFCFAGHPTVPAGCEPPPPTRPGTVEVVTYVGRYPPLYYAAVGWPSLVASGVAALEGMRLCSAVVCGLWLAGALWCAGRARVGQRRGLLLGVGLAATPQVVFFASVVNPSGLEVSAALCAWTAGLVVAGEARAAAAGARTGPRVGGAGGAGSNETGAGPLVWLAASAATLAATRGLSPLFALLIGVTVAAVAGWDGVVALARRRAARTGAAMVAVVGVAAVAWIVTEHALRVAPSSERFPTDNPLGMVVVTVGNVAAMALQYLGAFGWVDTFLPWAVVAAGLAAGTAVVVAAATASVIRHRVVVAAVAAGCLVVPVALSLSQGVRLGVFGQARTWMPLWVGLPLVATGAPGAWPAGRTRLRLPGRRFPLSVGGGLLAAAGALQVGAWWWALHRYRVGLGHPWFSPARWQPPVPAAALALAVVAAVTFLAWWVSGRWRSAPATLSEDPRPARPAPAARADGSGQRRWRRPLRPAGATRGRR